MLAGTVMLGDLDDFITPSQSCVNPLFADSVNARASATPTSTHTEAVDQRGLAKIAIESDLLAPVAAAAPVPVKPNLIKSAAGNTAKVSLNDCLACSGCVTSAETVLITQQSAAEVLAALSRTRAGAADTDVYAGIKLRIASVAPQVLASLAVHYSLSGMVEAYERLTTWLLGLGFDAVVDTSVCTHVSVLESCMEFWARMQNAGCIRASGAASVETAEPRKGRPAWTAPPPSVAVSSTRLQRVAATTAAGTVTAVADPEPAPAARPAEGDALPVLASSCPGWVCYAEKTTPEALPYVSAVKSPQQVTGSCIKHLLSSAHGVQWLTGRADASALCAPSEIYHVSVMACYDRKLEASRKDFYWETATSKEVDCVLTSGEIVEMLRESGADLAAIERTPRRGWHSGPLACAPADAPVADAALAGLCRLMCGVNEAGTILITASDSHASSDAFAETIYRFTADRLGLPVVGPVPFTAGKNADFQTATLLDASGATVATFALAYGFRNIQTVINKMKRGKSGLHYVEIMACPSGCINGGGQTKPTAVARDATPSAAASATPGVTPPPANPLLLAEQANKQRLHDAIAALHTCEPVSPWRFSPAAALHSWLTETVPSEQFAELLYTRYHHVPKLETGVTKW